MIRGLELFEIISGRIIDNPNYLYNKCFSNECFLFLNGEINRHNCCYCTKKRYTPSFHRKSTSGQQFTGSYSWTILFIWNREWPTVYGVVRKQNDRYHDSSALRKACLLNEIFQK